MFSGVGDLLCWFFEGDDGVFELDEMVDNFVQVGSIGLWVDFFLYWFQLYAWELQDNGRAFGGD